MRSYRSEEGKLVRNFLNLGCNELYGWMKDPGETDRRLGQSVCESYSKAPERRCRFCRAPPVANGGLPDCFLPEQRRTLW
jgi:hypothetical protein